MKEYSLYTVLDKLDHDLTDPNTYLKNIVSLWTIKKGSGGRIITLYCIDNRHCHKLSIGCYLVSRI
jgi:hypothetical protein